MAVVIRFQRHGETHNPQYRIVAADERAPTSGKFIEKLGYYDPSRKVLGLKGELVQKYYGEGARITPAVRALVKREKIKLSRTKTHKPHEKKK